MRKLYRGIAVILAGIMVFGVIQDRLSVRATESTQETIAQKKEEINEAKKEREKLKDGLSDIKKMVNDLEKSKSSLTEYVKELDGQLISVGEKIEQLKESITEKEKEIEETKQELEEAVKTEEEQYAAMKKRIKLMYERGNHFYVDMVLGASSFGDMLNMAENVKSISDYDRRKLEEYQLNRELIEVVKQELEEEEETLREAKALVEQEQDNLELLIDNKNKEITAYESDIATQEQAIKEYEEYIREQDAMIASLEQALKAMEESSRKYDGGVFAWPAPASYGITSPFGWRMHPILNVNKFHNGVDLGAAGGTPIVAAYDGTVVAAGYSSTMGNYIYLNHGSGLVTIYMHASALYVSTGQEVSKGETIAAVGTTGRSTGNHLHFGVRKDGAYVDPMGYIN